MNIHKEHIAVITGGTGGIGLQSAIGIAKAGGRIIITGRNHERGEVARQRIAEESGNSAIELVIGDVSSIAGIDALATELNNRLDHIDVLVNNAGYLGNELKTNDDGLEKHFAVNVLAPWRLTMALLYTLKKAKRPRVLNITGGDKPSEIDPENLQAEKGFQGLKTYQHSKSILESMSMALASHLESEDVGVNVLFPGRASTPMTSAMSADALPGAMKLFYPLLRLLFREDGGKSAAKAARSTIWGATSPALDGVTGRYFDTNSREQKMHPTAYDPEVQAKILALIKESSPAQNNLASE